MPDNPKSDYYNSSSARIIDEYKLTSNNCTTMVSDVLNKKWVKCSEKGQGYNKQVIWEHGLLFLLSTDLFFQYQCRII